MKDREIISQAIKSNRRRLKKKNVVGTGIGEKWIDGKPTGKPAILVFVQKKESNANIIQSYSAKEIIPKEIDGIETDVIEVGEIIKHGFKSKTRPIKPGHSVGHGKITAGTIGGIFLDSDGDKVILSNCHVLANEGNANPGDIIYQPGPSDNRENKRFRQWPDPVNSLPYIGTLKKFAKLNKTRNLHDSAIAKIHEKIEIDDVYPTIDRRLEGFKQASIGTQAQKCGRTTGYTTGRVIGLGADMTVGYDFGGAAFKNCIVLSAMSQPGDSGSLILDMDMNAIGLLFAGSDQVTIANPIHDVANHYGLKLLSNNINPKELTINSQSWEKVSNPNSKLIVDNNGKIIITSRANCHCYYEHPISSLRSISCVVNKSTDNGATWAPGITVQWPNGILKVNIRATEFGGYVNTDCNINVGKPKPDTNYIVRIRKTSNSWVGEVCDSGIWYTVVETSIFGNNPTAIRIGKTDTFGANTDFKTLGEIGTCFIADFKID